MIYSTEDPHFIIFLKPSLWRIPGVVHDHYNKRQQKVGAGSARKRNNKLLEETVPDFVKCLEF